MTEEEDEQDVDAGEFVLGTLGSAEMEAAGLRAIDDEAFAGRVAWWREQLAPLASSAPPNRVSPGLWRKVNLLTRTVGHFEGSGHAPALVALAKQRARWKAAALTSTTMLAALIAGGLGYLSLHPPQHGRYVAVLNDTDKQPALLATFEAGTGKLIIHSLAINAPTGRSLELWYIAEDQAPRSLGLVTPHSTAAIGLDFPWLHLGGKPASIGISAEPLGGSPNGRPSGPMLYSGRILPLK